MVIWQQRRSNLGYGYNGVAGTITNKAYSYVGASALNGNDVIAQNVWHNFVFTIDGSNAAKLYIDGDIVNLSYLNKIIKKVEVKIKRRITIVPEIKPFDDILNIYLKDTSK